MTDQQQMGGEPPTPSDDRLVIALYLLLRDHVHPGDMENAVLQVEPIPGVLPAPEEVPRMLTNDYLVGYAQNLAHRLRVAPTEAMVNAAARSLYLDGNARLGTSEEERPFGGTTKDIYRDEARSALIAALETQTSVRG